MTEVSDTLDCLQRIETILASIERRLAECQKPTPETFSEIRQRLRRLRYNREFAERKGEKPK